MGIDTTESVGLPLGIVEQLDDRYEDINNTVEQGTAFPSSPSTNDRFYRTDRHIEYYWDGTQWLSVRDYVNKFGQVNGASSSQALWSVVPFYGLHSIYLLDWTVVNYRSLAGEWDSVLSWRNAASTNTILSTRDGLADANATWVAETLPLNTALPAGAVALQVSFNEISGTATLNADATLRYKLIG